MSAASKRRAKQDVVRSYTRRKKRTKLKEQEPEPKKKEASEQNDDGYRRLTKALEKHGAKPFVTAMYTWFSATEVGSKTMLAKLEDCHGPTKQSDNNLLAMDTQKKFSVYGEVSPKGIEDLINKLPEFLPGRRTFLDLGCGRGIAALSAFLLFGPRHDVDVIGIELNRDVYRTAQFVALKMAQEFQLNCFVSDDGNTTIVGIPSASLTLRCDNFLSCEADLAKADLVLFDVAFSSQGEIQAQLWQVYELYLSKMKPGAYLAMYEGAAPANAAWFETLPFICVETNWSNAYQMALRRRLHAP